MLVQFLKNRFIVQRIIRSAKKLLENPPDDITLAMGE
ncbi:MAG: hypothetical protein SCARUB_04797 [Candidatus Scalindua rubra]|uniref:Uncharacterized protein n=1 Tax=Candidatus Scalindua rubra TaxID=1872076 RepID=A0A1E3X543_9BACT|nr:MAG: hypothetical protein SCARUB_04797 [Candidatus Scalindua rubra]